MRLQGLGWLLLAALAAIVVPASGVDRALLAALAGIAPWPWDRVTLGVLLFLAVSALHFRSHWAACQRVLSAYARRQQRLLDALRDDLEQLQRSLHVARDNLHETPAPDGLARLYHEGAGAHAERALAIARRIEERCRGAAHAVRADDESP